ncbi:hypothetical protein BABINDRAFT_160087 [Babjeviella inositovora NRRL Y-12698]|uniref:Ribosomal RNA-processing protein 17 n=1 Tax=Babjeviella inositovora NRRL Y-12698 TaxID=984486 RepID=A0A1E3QW05_9ASCO|nr:uncharacterized protein BABINDRAFT_160087 [Babjeviella inositovora NRRL Y-12698]ODQ81856.1 hypothetical protein BABINDRAFT_160087 [Babjeviella inositovora NRRL Y-12698]
MAGKPTKAGRPNREILSGGKKYATKQANKHRVAEVVFDKDARVEYLTGFHKRKIERQKKAKDYNIEQERLARLEERKKMREERKKDVEDQLKKFNDTVMELTGGVQDDDEDWSGFKTEKAAKDESEDETDAQKQVDEANGILNRKEIYIADNENAPVAGESTVTIESLDPNAENLALLAKANHMEYGKAAEMVEKDESAESKEEKKRAAKKKKFRYLSKAERRDNTRKERSKNSRPKRDAPGAPTGKSGKGAKGKGGKGK